METVPVVELTRGCMYTDPKDWTGCSRLAYSMIRVRVGSHIQMHTRCKEHRNLVGPFGWHGQIIHEVSPYTMRLGYKP